MSCEEPEPKRKNYGSQKDEPTDFPSPAILCPISSEGSRAKENGSQHVLMHPQEAIVVTGASAGRDMHANNVNVFQYCSVVAPSVQGNISPRIEFNIQDTIKSFTGRVGVLDALHNAIQENRKSENPTVISQAQAVTGMGGIGKTETTRKYMNDFKGYYWHRLWINAETSSQAEECFYQIATMIKSINVRNHQGNLKLFQFIIEEIYDFLCTKTCLIVLDNATSLENGDGEDGVRKFFPKAIKTGWEFPAILVTSRNREWGSIKVIQLNGFQDSECFELLKSELEFEDSDENRNLVQQITFHCEGLPLVVQQVIAVIKDEAKISLGMGNEPYTMKTFLDELQAEKQNYVEAVPADSKVGESVFQIFSIAFRKIAEKPNGKLAIKCLDVMALLNPDSIPTQLLHCLLRKDEPHKRRAISEALNLLHKYNLITMIQDTCKIHRMIQAVKLLTIPRASSENGICFASLKASIISTFRELIDSFPLNKGMMREKNLALILENGSSLLKHVFKEPMETEAIQFVRVLASRLEFYYNNREYNTNETKTDRVTLTPIKGSGIQFNVQKPATTFTGRESTLEYMDFSLNGMMYYSNVSTRNDSQILVILGAAGVGKTELARKYVQQYSCGFRHCLWINAESYSQAKDCFKRIADVLQIQVVDTSRQAKPLSRLLEEVYQSLSAEDCLIVFDNASSLKEENGIKQFLPDAALHNFFIIVTTRERDLVFSKQRTIELWSDVNSIKDNFLIRELQLENTPENSRIAKEITALCEGLPLLIQLVIAYIRGTIISRGTKVQQPYSLKDFKHEYYSNKIRPDPCKMSQHTLMIMLSQRELETFKFLLRNIKEKVNGELALTCLDILALLSPDNVPTDLVVHLLQPAGRDAVTAALKLLEIFRFITVGKDVCSMHRKIQDLARKASMSEKIGVHQLPVIRSAIVAFTELLDEMNLKQNWINSVFESGIQLGSHICDNDQQQMESEIVTNFLCSLIKRLFVEGNYHETVRVCQMMKPKE